MTNFRNKQSLIFENRPSLTLTNKYFRRNRIRKIKGVKFNKITYIIEKDIDTDEILSSKIIDQYGNSLKFDEDNISMLLDS